MGYEGVSKLRRGKKREEASDSKYEKGGTWEGKKAQQKSEYPFNVFDENALHNIHASRGPGETKQKPPQKMEKGEEAARPVLPRQADSKYYHYSFRRLSAFNFNHRRPKDNYAPSYPGKFP